MVLLSALLIKILLSLYFAVNRLNSMIVCNLIFSHIFCWLDTESKLNTDFRTIFYDCIILDTSGINDQRLIIVFVFRDEIFRLI